MDLLVILSLLIIIIIFIISTIIYLNWSNNQKQLETQEEQDLIKTQNEHNISFIKMECNSLFCEYEKEMNKININTNISEFNKKYKYKLIKIIEFQQYKSIIQTKDNAFYKEGKFLLKLKNESPFVWMKKYEKEIKTYFIQNEK